MSNKEYKNMVRLYLKLKHLLNKYYEILEVTSEKDTSEKDDSPPIMIPADVYDDICKALGKSEIGLMGIS